MDKELKVLKKSGKMSAIVTFYSCGTDALPLIVGLKSLLEIIS